MKIKRINLIVFIGLLFSIHTNAQEPVKQKEVIDTAIADYDVLFNELDALLDSLIKPRSFAMFDIGLGNRYFNYGSKSSYLLEAAKKLTFTPSLNYFDKSGLGFCITSVVINDGTHVSPFQFNLTASYDYIKNPRFITGLALTHFFTKDSLPFYTSPLKNEAYVYFSYRNFWLKPGIAASYGWGSRSDYYHREDYITSLQLASTGYTTINTRESINDFNLMVTVRHDFYWLNVLFRNDYIRISPQIVYTSGTQQFGFNQTSNTYTGMQGSGISVLSNSDKTYLDNQLYFQPLSLATYIKAEYSKGKFFVQPQILFDYYFPTKSKNLNTIFLIDAGVIF